MNTTQKQPEALGTFNFLFGWFASVKATQSQRVGKRKQKEIKKEWMNEKEKSYYIFYWKCVFGTKKMLWSFFYASWFFQVVGVDFF